MNQLNTVVQNAVGSNQISDAKGVELTTQEAKAFMDSIHFKTIPSNLQGIVAQGFITAHEWNEARARLEIAFGADGTGVALTTDQLRYARCLANLGDVDGAIRYSRMAFAAPPEQKSGILLAVYLEIVPPAVKIKPAATLELAQLVEDAISQHKLARPIKILNNDEEIVAQDLWVSARPYHILQAWKLAIQLYRQANRPDLASKAQTLMTADAAQFKQTQAL